MGYKEDCNILIVLILLYQVGGNPVGAATKQCTCIDDLTLRLNSICCWDLFISPVVTDSGSIGTAVTYTLWSLSGQDITSAYDSIFRGVLESLYNVTIAPTLTLDLASKFELTLEGIQIDFTFFAYYELALQQAYATANPAIAARGLRIKCPRVNEILGSIGAPFSLALYWVIANDTTGTESVLKPGELVVPSSSAIQSTLDQGKVKVKVTTGIPTFKDLTFSFGVFFRSLVMGEDISAVITAVQSIWKASADTNLQAATVVFGNQELYYTSATVGGIDVKQTITWGQLNRFSYFLKLVDGTVIRPTGFNLTIPTQQEYQTAIDKEAMPSGKTYMLHATGDMSVLIDHTTLSSTQYRRATESLKIHIKGRAVKETFASVATGVQTLIQKVTSSKQSFSAAKVDVADSVEYFTDGGKASYLVVFAQVGNLMVDLRRFETVLPNATSIAKELSSVSLPDGSKFEFITNVNMTMSVVKRKDAYVQVCKGIVQENDYKNFSVAITEALKVTDASLFSMYDSVDVKVMDTEERISQTGESVTAVFYRVNLKKGIETIQLKSDVSSKAKISLSNLQLKVNSLRRSDGTQFQILSTDVMKTSKRYDNIFKVYLESNVLDTDYESFKSQIKTFLGNSITSFKFNISVQTQKEYKTEKGVTINALGYFIEDTDSMRSVIPVGIPKINLQSLSQSVAVTSLSGQSYKMITDVSILDKVSRVSSLYSIDLTSSVSEQSKTTIMSKVVEQIKKTNTVFSSGTVQASVLSVDEYVDRRGKSGYKVFYKIMKNNKRVSRRKVSTATTIEMDTIFKTVKNARGRTYNRTVISTTEYIVARKLITTLLNRPVVQNDVQSIENVFIDNLKVELSKKSSALSQKQVKIKIIRTREGVTSQNDKVYMVDCEVNIGNNTIEQSVFPKLDESTIMKSLPKPQGASYTIVSGVDMKTVFDLRMGFRFLVSDLGVKVSDFSSISNAVKTVVSSTFSGATVSVKTTEEVIAINSTSFTSVVFSVILTSGVMANPEVEATINAQNIMSAMQSANIIAPSGSAYKVVTSSINVERKSKAYTFTVMDDFSSLDKQVVGTSLQTILTSLGTVNSIDYSTMTVQVLQTNTLLTLNGTKLTEIVCFIKTKAGETVQALTVPSLNLGKFATDLAGTTSTLTSGLSYKWVDIATMEAYDTRYLFDTNLSVFVRVNDISAITTKFEGVFESISEFSSYGKINVVIAKQRELILKSGKSVVDVVCIVRSSRKKLISSKSVSKLSTSNVNTGLSVSMTGTSQQYANYLSTASQVDIETAIDIEEMGMIVVDEFVSSSQYASFSSVITEIYKASNTAISGFKCTVRKVEYVSSLTERSSGYAIYFAIESSKRIIRMVDIKRVQTSAISQAISRAATLKTRFGRSYKVLEKITIKTSVRKSQMLTKQLILTERIQEADLVKCEQDFTAVIAKQLEGLVTGTIAVRIARQLEIVSEKSVSRSYFDIGMAITVNGKVFDARTFVGSVDMAALKLKLASLTVSGTKLKFTNILVENVATTLGATFEYNKLSNIPVVTSIKETDFTAVSAVLKTFVASTIGVSANSCEVKIRRQEKVTDKTGKIFTRLSFGIKVNGVEVDARTISSLNLAALSQQIQSNSQLNSKVSVAATTDFTGGYRLQDSQQVCFQNQLTLKDINEIISTMKNVYSDMDAVDSNLDFTGPNKETSTIKFLRTETSTTETHNCQNKASAAEFLKCLQDLVTCFNYVFHAGERIIYQLPDDNAFSTALNLIFTEANQRFVYKIRGADTSFIAESSLYKFYMMTMIRRDDSVKVFDELKKTWILARSDLTALTVNFVTQREVFTKDGMLIVEVLYSVINNKVVIDSQVQADIDISIFKTKLQAVQVTGISGRYYKDYVYTGDVSNVMVKTSLCSLMVRQKIAVSQYSEFSSRITTAWKKVDSASSSVVISVIGKETYVTEYTEEAYNIYFTAALAGSTLSCKNGNAAFIDAVAQALQGLNTIQGEAFTVVQKDIAIAAISKMSSYSLYMTRSVANQDIVKVESALSEVWKTQKSQTVTVKLALDEEYISSTKEYVRRARYFVKTSSMKIDARLEGGLSVTDIEEALKKVTVSTSSTTVTYNSFLYKKDVSLLFNYQYRFTINLNMEIRDIDFSKFTSVIQTSWQNSGVATTNLQISVVTQEEVIDKDMKTAYQLVYFVSNTSAVMHKVLDATLINAVTSTTYEQNTKSANIIGARGMQYTVVQGLMKPIYRRSQSFKIYVEGRVDVTHNTQFKAIAEKLWKKSFSTVQVTMVRQEEYISKRKWATGFIYFVQNTTTSSTKKMLTENIIGNIKVTDIETEVQSLKRKDGSSYTIIDKSKVSVYRYVYHFGVLLKSPSKTVDVEKIVPKLLTEWKTTLPGLTSLTVEIGLQEEMVNVTGETYWKIVYFLNAGGKTIHSMVYEMLSQNKLTTALDVTMSGSTSSSKYSSLLVTSSTTKHMRISDLFSVYITQKVSQTKFTAFQTAIEAVWVKKSSSNTGVVTKVLTQQKYVTDKSQIVHRLFYKAEKSTIMIKKRDVEEPAIADFMTEIAKIDTLRSSVKYEMVNSEVVMLWRYESAFVHILTKPVIMVQKKTVLDALTVQWKTVLSTELGTNLQLNFAIERELLDSNGASVFGFSYFAIATSGMIDAMFEVNLDIAKQKAVFTTTPVFEGDINTLVPFDHLLPVPLTTRVMETRITEIETAIQTAWRAVSFSMSLSQLAVKVVSQEEYLTETGDFVYSILFSASMNGKMFDPVELPEVNPATAYRAIENIAGASGSNYVLSQTSVMTLKRFKSAMHISVDKWVKRKDVVKMTAVIEKVVSESIQNGTVQYGTQEYYYDTTQNKKVVKLSFFVSVQNKIINSFYEGPVDIPALTTRLQSNDALKYSLLTIQSGSTTVLNLRYSFHLVIDGGVAMDDLTVFSNAIKAKWSGVLASVNVNLVTRMEQIGTRGELVHTLVYFLDVNGAQILPGTRMEPTLSSIQVTSTVTGKVYKQYTGAVVNYRNTYSIMVNGEIASDTANTIASSIKAIWTTSINQALAGATVDIKMELLEPSFAEFGAQVTNCRYSVMVNKKMTFPENDPSPPMTDLFSAVEASTSSLLGVISVYRGKISSVYRVNDHFSINIQGTVNKAVKVSLENTIKTTWNNKGLSSPTFQIVGRYHRYSSVSNVTVSQVFYRLSTSTGIIHPYDVSLPLATDFSLPTGLSVFTATTYKVQSIMMNSRLSSTSAISAFKTGVSAAWQKAQGTGSFVVSTNITNQVTYRKSVDNVYKVHYAASINGKSPENLDPPGLIPTALSVKNELTAASSPLPCGCVAKRLLGTTMGILLRGAPNTINGATLQNAITTAWQNKNPSIPKAQIKMNVTTNGISVAPSGRRKRQTQGTGSTTYQDGQGNPLTPLEYVASIGDGNSDSDPLFLDEPTRDELVKAITDAGLLICQTDCQPATCKEMTLQGKVEPGNTAAIGTAIEDAYLAANPSLNKGDIRVNVTILNNELEDQNMNPLSKIKYCISRLDNGNVGDLQDPSADQLRSPLNGVGFPPITDDQTPTSKGPQATMKWIIIIIVICAVAAVVIVILAVGKVIHRKRQWGKEDEMSSQYDNRALTEEDFPGHGAYMAPIYGGSTFNKSHNGSLSSKVHFYDRQGEIYPN